jgi:hypothetical protein
MQRLEVSGAVRHTYIYIYIYIYVVRRQRVNLVVTWGELLAPCPICFTLGEPSNIPQYPLSSRLGEPQSRSGRDKLV